MNKTIYVRDADVLTWERAAEIFGKKLSPLLTEALRRLVAEHDDALRESVGEELGA